MYIMVYPNTSGNAVLIYPEFSSIGEYISMTRMLFFTCCDIKLNDYINLAVILMLEQLNYDFIKEYLSHFMDTSVLLEQFGEHI
jgi:hypothetical protein